ncbi:MAG: TetR/AcrR family transcriptional regulator [Propionibacteriaceae bacterium]|jgi:AcrR family transcriptional regulator|nr:TetR/AcrR family transcriptional regulator [Propionibacteriaceae bacterium]
MLSGNMSKPAGRPRSAATRQAILAAAAGLIAEFGYDGVTVEAIAARAGAGKQTIYRLWGSKARLAADAVRTGALPFPAVAVPDTGAVGADLRQWFADTLPLTASPPFASLVRALLVEQATIAYGGTPRVEPAFLPTEQALRGRLTLARVRGEVRPDIDVDAVIDLVIGVQTMVMLGATASAVPPVDAWLDTLMHGIEAAPGSR